MKIGSAHKARKTFFTRILPRQDGSGNIYVAGATINGAGNYDMLLTKYNSSGVEQWTKTVAGAAGMDDIASDVYIDGAGNVFLTGAIVQSVPNNYDIVLLKYNSSGTLQWTSYYNNSSGSPTPYDGGTSITMDGSGNIYVGGGSFGNNTGSDCILIKYNSSGTYEWDYRYDYNGNNDVITQLTYNSTTLKVVATGGSESSSGNWDYVTINYDVTGLSVPVIQRYSGTAGGVDEITDLAVDAGGNIYITGTSKNMNSDYDFKTIKLSPSFSTLWTAVYDGPDNGDDKANGLRVDASGNVYVTGYTTTAAEGENFATIKYNSSGSQQWIQFHNGLDNGEDKANAIALDASGNIYVTGQSKRKENLDFYTIKYDPSGTKLWEMGYNGPGNGDDKTVGIAVDNSDNVYVSGQSLDLGESHTYTTIRYVQRALYTVPDDEEIPTHFEVLENRGQLLNIDHTPASSVKFYTDQTYPSVYFKPSTISFVWEKVDTSANTPDTLHRVDVSLNRNPVNCYGMNPYESHTNFYLGHLQKGLERIEGYNTIVYPQVYGNVDAEFTANNAGVKFRFVVKPSGSAGSISMDFSGAGSLSVNGSGDLVIGSLLGDLTFKKARAYQIDNNGDKITLGWQPSYSVSGGTVTFSSVGTYNTSLPLVIEMYEHDAYTRDDDFANIGWSTLYGGNDFDVVNDIAADETFHGVLTAGYTLSHSYPLLSSFTITPVPLQQTDYFNATVVNFKEDGRRNWTAVIGGYANDMATAIATDGANTAYIVGHSGKAHNQSGTLVDNNFPQTTPSGSYSKSPNNMDTRYGWIVKMQIAGGIIEWSTLMGDDGTNAYCRPGSIHVDANSKDVFVCGNAYMSASLTPPLQQFELETYLGQTINHAGTSIEQGSGAGGFITVFTPNNVMKWSTIFGGATQINDILTDESGIYVLSTVQPSYTIPQVLNGLGNGTYDPPGHAGGPSGGQNDWHLMKLNHFNVANPLRISWAFPFGGDGHDQANKMAMAHTYIGSYPMDFVVCVGYTTSSSSSLPFPEFNQSLPDAYVDNTSTTTDALIAAFDAKVGAPQWLTYYGGDGGSNEEFYTATYDSDRKVLYVAGKTSSPDNEYPSPNLADAYIDDSKAYSDEDGLLLAFDDQFRLVYSTLYGAHDDDYFNEDRIYGIAVTGNNLFIGGLSGNTDPTVEYNIPIQKEHILGYTQELTTGHPFDGFVAKLKINETPLTVDENELMPSLILYPNPTNGLLFILTEHCESLLLFDATGKLVDFKVIYMPNYITIDLSNLAQGLYTIKVDTGKGSRAAKIIKQ